MADICYLYNQKQLCENTVVSLVLCRVLPTVLTHRTNMCAAANRRTQMEIKDMELLNEENWLLEPIRSKHWKQLESSKPKPNKK